MRIHLLRGKTLQALFQTLPSNRVSRVKASGFLDLFYFLFTCPSCCFLYSYRRTHTRKTLKSIGISLPLKVAIDVFFALLSAKKSTLETLLYRNQKDAWPNQSPRSFRCREKVTSRGSEPASLNRAGKFPVCFYDARYKENSSETCPSRDPITNKNGKVIYTAIPESFS